MIAWFGLGGHELRLTAGEMRTVRSLASLVEVAGAAGARSAGGREKKVREEAARLQEEAERVQAALGEGERALQRLVDARATVTEVLAEPPAAVAERGGEAARSVHRARGTARQNAAGRHPARRPLMSTVMDHGTMASCMTGSVS
ncbi:hypothetical protein AB0935_25505 [Streptomyces sp. NPDC007027]|uniref:hypothetical protein n=1 Tax=unclassified Streptomyces TaxID=2593676 RepID=UPI0033C1A462